MTSAVSRFLTVLLWIGMLMFLSDLWEPLVLLLLSSLAWLEANPAWIPVASLYLACVIVKSYLVIQMLPFTQMVVVRYAGLKPDAQRDAASMTFSSIVCSVALLFLVIPVMIQERSQFWRCYTRRELVETARQNCWLMRHLRRMNNGTTR